MPTVAVLGAGTMGAGIAQVAAAHGWSVRLYDVRDDALRRAADGIRAALERQVEKGRLPAAACDATLARITLSRAPEDAAGCELVLEAVIEDAAAKVAALAPLATVAAPDAILASNTSSLSITRIAGLLGPAAAPRVVGMHFFNPAPLMPLVEIVSGRATDAPVADRAAEIARAWGKTPVRAKDTPGFIVNRVARGYYLESLRMLGEGIAGVDEIDRTLTGLGGFRMGPFELMDLIGIDVNYAVTCSVWEQMGRPARLAPHAIQADLVQRGRLGRKSQVGFYDYRSTPPVPAARFERASFDLAGRLYEAVRRFADAALPDSGGSTTQQYVFARVLAAIVNEAAHAIDEGVAAGADVDVAMKLGTNYPLGPIDWAERIGRNTTAALLRALDERAGDGRFAPAGWFAHSSADR